MVDPSFNRQHDIVTFRVPPHRPENLLASSDHPNRLIGCEKLGSGPNRRRDERPSADECPRKAVFQFIAGDEVFESETRILILEGDRVTD